MISHIISLILLFSVVGLLFWGAEKARQLNKTPKRNKKNGRYTKRK